MKSQWQTGRMIHALVKEDFANSITYRRTKRLLQWGTGANMETVSHALHTITAFLQKSSKPTKTLS